MGKYVYVGLAAIVLAFLLSPREPYAKTTSTYFPAHAPLEPTPPSSIWVDGQYLFGRYKHGIPDIAFHSENHEEIAQAIAHLPSRFQTKYWHFTSFNTREFFVGFALVQLQYVSDVFLYIIDKNTLEKFEFNHRLPGTIGVSFALSSVDNSTCSIYQDVNQIEACFIGDAWHIKASVPVTSSQTHQEHKLEFDVKLNRDEALTLLYPLADDPLRPAYVHKGAGSQATGTLQFKNDHFTLENALGAIDWTKSMALRETIWNWASTSYHINDTAIGINLSQHVYDVDGASQENAIWINGTVCALGGVHFHVPDDKSGVWTIESLNSTEVYLEFTPAGVRYEDNGVPYIAQSKFFQPYGTFDGRISCVLEGSDTAYEFQVKNAFGISKVIAFY
uniref:Secreted protein n=1 Tax=Thraustotheca clavata TaxID=74557 RepID=A0A0A7CMK0_9STRA|nr:secreted protein [Thraustotheca clavata]